MLPLVIAHPFAGFVSEGAPMGGTGKHALLMVLLEMVAQIIVGLADSLTLRTGPVLQFTVS